MANDVEAALHPRHRNDRIPDKLTRPVIGDVSATIDIEHRRTDAVERFLGDRQIGSVTVPTNRVGVGVLEEQQIVIAGAARRSPLPDRPLEVPRLLIGDTPEPAVPKHAPSQKGFGHLSSCSQSHVSRFSLMRFRNNTAVDPSNTLWSQLRPRYPM